MGSAAGIAKARAALEAKRAAQRAAKEQGQQSGAVTVIPADGSAPLDCSTDPADPPAALSRNQTLALNQVSAGAAEGARFLRQTVRNPRAAPRLRYDAACSLLSFAGFGQKGGPADDGEDELEKLGRLASVIELRRRAAGAETVVPEQPKDEKPQSSE